VRAPVIHAVFSHPYTLGKLFLAQFEFVRTRISVFRHKNETLRLRSSLCLGCAPFLHDGIDSTKAAIHDPLDDFARLSIVIRCDL
jgi:hypothetical protein